MDNEKARLVQVELEAGVRDRLEEVGAKLAADGKASRVPTTGELVGFLLDEYADKAAYMESMEEGEVPLYSMKEVMELADPVIVHAVQAAVEYTLHGWYEMAIKLWGPRAEGRLPEATPYHEGGRVSAILRRDGRFLTFALFNPACLQPDSKDDVPERCLLLSFDPLVWDKMPEEVKMLSNANAKALASRCREILQEEEEEE